MSRLALLIAVFLASFLLTAVLKKLAFRARLIDSPVARSAHTVPKPLGGGLIIVLLFSMVASYYFIGGAIPLREFMALTGGMVIAIVGLLDDLSHLDIRWRVPTQFAAAIWSVWWLGDVPPVDMGGATLQLQWLLNGSAVVSLVWLLNLYNFMDGIDGLAGCELVFVCVLSLILATNSGDQVLTLLSGVLLAAGAGFLGWNWAPAKIFMGDVGSGFVGFTLGIFALFSIHHGTMTVWTWVILLAVFIADATITVIRRYVSGEKWFEGHATHAYQNAARSYKSHSKVTITVILINCIWLAPLAWLSVRQPQAGVYLALIALFPLVLVAIRLKAGKSVEVALLSL